MAQPTQKDPQFKLRLPADLKQRIDVQAAVNNRSINAEIISRLEQSFSEENAISELLESEESLLDIVSELRESRRQFQSQSQQLLIILERNAEEKGKLEAELKALKGALR